MKKLKKIASVMTSFLLLVLFTANMVYAADSSITFQGFSKGFDFQPGSEYTETDLFDNFKQVMPGDILTEEITFTNSAKDCDYIQLYIRAEAHEEKENPLSAAVAETETLSSMNDFLAHLSMKVWNGTELIFETSPNELGGLKENQFLGTFRTDETGILKVELTVPAELGNEFADCVGEVDWIFHVEAYNESQLSVRKVWSDGNQNHSDESITVNLLKDGEVEASQVLNAENGWAFTFDNLAEGYEWTAEETDVPEGYTVSYTHTGTMTTIINTKKEPSIPAGSPLDITVKKVWSNDEGKERPDSVTVTLYNGEAAYETVRLGEWNNWTYHWEDASVSGDWQVTEINIPKGYTPSYQVLGNNVTITNTRKLIQTGQLLWPMAVLCGAGIALIALGGVILFKKKKTSDA